MLIVPPLTHNITSQVAGRMHTRFTNARSTGAFAEHVLLRCSLLSASYGRPTPCDEDADCELLARATICEMETELSQLITNHLVSLSTDAIRQAAAGDIAR